jgi:hypothetical protein
MDISTLYPSKYLSAADLSDPTRVTIQGIAQEIVGMGSDAQTKPILSFVGQSKRLVLNKTNALTIAAQYGNDTAGWIGKQVVLKATTVPFQGKLVPAVRIDAYTPTPPPPPSAEPRRPHAALPTQASPPPYDGNVLL